MEVRRGFRDAEVSSQSEIALLAFVTSSGIHVALGSKVNGSDQPQPNRQLQYG